MARSVAPVPSQQQTQWPAEQDEGSRKAMMESPLQTGLASFEPGDSMEAPFPQDFESSEDQTTDQLANHLFRSAAIHYTEEKVNAPLTISSEYRADYTDEVRRKYFDSEKNETHFAHRYVLGPNNGHHKLDGGIPSKIENDFVPASNQSSLSSRGEGFYTKRSDDSVGTKKIQRGGYGGPQTPPLTLHSNMPSTTLSSTTPISNKESTPIQISDEMAGYMSPMSGMDSVEHTRPFSPGGSLTPEQNSMSDLNLPIGSLYSAASSKGSLIKQPVLYSAIGSLEHANNNSLTNLNKRFLAPSKEFCQPGGKSAATGGPTVQSRLLPPVRQYQNGQHKTNGSSGLQAEMSRQNLQTSRDKARAEATSLQPRPNLMENNSAQKRAGITTSSDLCTLPEDKLNPSKISSEHQENVGDKPATGQMKKAKRDSETSTSRRDGQNSNRRRGKANKKVSIDASTKTKKSKSKKVEMFRPSSDAYTPRIERKKIKYKKAEARPCVQQMSSPMGTLQRPNFRDALRRVAMIIHQHIVKIESRFEKQEVQFNRNTSRTKGATRDGLFHASMRDMFHEDSYRTPTYKCNMARIPMARPGMTYGLRKIKVEYEIPSETEIYNFGHQLFKSVQLSSECSIVCLIYVERLMEVAKVPLLACTWRPIFMCGLLLASKVWQDLSSWNIEFSSVYPQFSLEAINKLELNFLRNVKWDLYISSSSYAKYYFALRSLIEKKDFRQRYNRMVGGVGNVAQSEALKVQQRTEQVKEEALLQLSRSM